METPVTEKLPFKTSYEDYLADGFRVYPGFGRYEEFPENFFTQILKTFPKLVHEVVKVVLSNDGFPNMPSRSSFALNRIWDSFCRYLLVELENQTLEESTESKKERAFVERHVVFAIKYFKEANIDLDGYLKANNIFDESVLIEKKDILSREGFQERADEIGGKAASLEALEKAEIPVKPFEIAAELKIVGEQYPGSSVFSGEFALANTSELKRVDISKTYILRLSLPGDEMHYEGAFPTVKIAAGTPIEEALAKYLKRINNGAWGVEVDKLFKYCRDRGISCPEVFTLIAQEFHENITTGTIMEENSGSLAVQGDFDAGPNPRGLNVIDNTGIRITPEGKILYDAISANLEWFNSPKFIEHIQREYNRIKDLNLHPEDRLLQVEYTLDPDGQIFFHQIRFSVPKTIPREVKLKQRTSKKNAWVIQDMSHARDDASDDLISGKTEIEGITLPIIVISTKVIQGVEDFDKILNKAGVDSSKPYGLVIIKSTQTDFDGLRFGWELRNIQLVIVESMLANRYLSHSMTGVLSRVPNVVSCYRTKVIDDALQRADPMSPYLPVNCITMNYNSDGVNAVLREVTEV